ncbi:cation channel sperm-associated auxiliary subunit gamma-like isoform X1 [Branchiostoma floridae x Branchiostoma japonicum]
MSSMFRTFALCCFVCNIVCRTICASDFKKLQWWVDEIRYSHLTESVAVQSSTPLVPVGNVWKDLGVQNVVSELQDDYSAFPYWLRIQVKQNNKVSHSAARYLALRGITPVVRFLPRASPRVDNSLPSGSMELHGALIDQADWKVDHDNSSCYFLCEPAWLVPLPMDNYTSLPRVEVLGGGDAVLMKMLSEGVHIHHFHSQLLEFPDALGNKSDLSVSDLATWDPYHAVHIPLLSPSIIMTGFGNSTLGVFTSDQFETHNVIQFRIPSRQETNLCSDWTSAPPTIFSNLMFPGSLLLATSAGVVQYPLGEYANTTKCVSKLIGPSDPLSGRFQVLGIGGEPDKGDVLVADMTDSKYQAIDFVELVDHRNLSYCAVLDRTGDYSACTLVDAAISPVTNQTFLFLVLTNDMNADKHYHVMQFIGEPGQGTWEELSVISDKLPPKSQFDHFTWLTSDVQDQGQDQLTLTGMSFLGMVSQGLYLWGSAVLYSEDAGRTLWWLHTFMSNSTVTQLVPSGDGAFAFLTDSQELWYGMAGTTRLVKLRPSEGWSLAESFGDLQICSHNTSTLAIFMDINSELREVLTIVTNNSVQISSQTIPVIDILQHQTYLTGIQKMQTALAGTTDVDNFPVTIPRSCPYSFMQLEIPDIQHNSDMKKFNIRPARISYYRPVHTSDSLAVYSGMVHYMTHYKPPQEWAYSLAAINNFQNLLAAHENVQDYYTYMYSTRNIKDVFLSLEDYQEPHSNASATQFPQHIFLDTKASFIVYIRMNLHPAHPKDTETYEHTSMDHLQLSVWVSEPTLLDVTANKTVFYHNSSVLYQITVADTGVYKQQHPPGEKLQAVSLQMQPWNAPLNCFHQEKTQGVLSTRVMLGCPLSVKVLFDSATSLPYSITKYSCRQTDPDIPCFYLNKAFRPFFKVNDLVTRTSIEYKGNYTLLLIGGGWNSLSNVEMWSQEQVELYNPHFREDAPAMWWPGSSVLATDRIFSQNQNAISWIWPMDSPWCQLVPNMGAVPEYYLLFRFSNKGVDSSTNCEHTLQFYIRVYGNPVHYSFKIALLFATFVFGLLAAITYYLCHRNDAKLWNKVVRPVTDRMYNTKTYLKRRLSMVLAPPTFNADKAEGVEKESGFQWRADEDLDTSEGGVEEPFTTPVVPMPNIIIQSGSTMDMELSRRHRLEPLDFTHQHKK